MASASSSSESSSPAGTAACDGSRGGGEAELARKQYENIKCLHFMGELRMCYSAFYQFHQQYIYGKFSNCKVFKERVKNCIKWRTGRSEEARDKLIKSIEEEEQANMHTPCPVWRLRDKPPEEWNSPSIARHLDSNDSHKTS